MATVFFTGFPGFLGAALLPRVLERRPEAGAVCLVQTKFARLARERLAALEATNPGLAGRVRLAEGDITRPDLGLGNAYGTLAGETREIYHLAALYDLGAARDPAMRINVEGTRHMLDFAEAAVGLERFQYVSTCYVSGRYAGIFTEDDLVKGQAFNNWYEESKYLAEVEVQRRMQGGLPATIYRPSIVVGDARTGETQKYDGPYFVIQWLLRQPSVALMPVVGDPSMSRVNVVPRDFVVAAIAHLSGLDRAVGRVYQLADPAPLTVDEMLEVIGRVTKRMLVRVPMTRESAKFALDWVPGVYGLLRIPAPAIDYFVQPTHYTVEHAQVDLAAAGLHCPPFASYADKLVEFVKRHPEIGAKPMA